MARILVTVGMGPWPFDRLVGALAPVCAGHEVFAQTGASTVAPPCEHAPFVPLDELRARMAGADIVITHAGNTVRLVQRLGGVPIAVAREHARGEMGNDHQVAYLREEERTGRVVAVWDVARLPEAVDGHAEAGRRLRERPVPAAVGDDGFTLVAGSMTDADLPPEAAMVLAMGSLQYTADPEAAITHLAGWLRPGGVLAILVDSLTGLVLELLRDGRTDEALDRLTTRRGVYERQGHAADLHLLDRARTEAAFAAAGLTEVRSHGLLVSASALGRDALTRRLTADRDAQMAVERRLADDPLLADTGKQLLVTGRRPG